MIITEYQIDRYRDGNPLKVLDLGNGLNVALVGDAIERNAMFNVLTFVLYGNEAQSQPRGDAAHILAHGAHLIARTDNGVFRIERHEDPELPFGTDVVISSPDGTVHDPAYLEALIDGIDPRTFDRVFTLSGRNLERSIRRNRDHMLSEIEKIAKYLQHRSPEISAAKTTSRTVAVPNSLNGLDRYVVDLTSLIRQQIDLDADTTTVTNGDLPSKQRTKTELKKIDAALVEFQQKEKLIDREVFDTQLAIRLSQLQTRLANVQRELSQIREAPEKGSKKQDDSVRREVKDIEAKIRRCKEQLEEVSDQKKEVQLNMQGDKRLARIKELRPRAEAVLLQEKFLVNEEQSIEQLGSSIRDLEARTEAERHQQETRSSELSMQSGRAMQYLSDVDRFHNQLRDAKAQYRQARSRYKSAKSTKQRYSDVDERRDEYRSDPDTQYLESDREQIREAEALVLQLREKINVDAEMIGLSQEHRELFSQVQRLYEDALPPWRVVMALGIPFMIGAGMTVAGLFGYTETQWDLVGWGMMIAIGTALFKLSIDFRSGDHLSIVRRKLREISRSLRDAQRSQSELDQTLPDDPNSLQSQLRMAERRLADLRGMANERQPERRVRRKRKSAAPRRSSAELDRLRRRASETQSRYRDVSGRWKNLLQELGLPQTMSPSEARFTIEQRANEQQNASSMPDSALDFQLRQLRHDLERRRNGLNDMLNHSRQIVSELGFSTTGAAIGEQMDIIREAIQELDEENQNRREYDRSLKDLKDQDSKLRKEGRRLSQQRQDLIATARRSEEEEKSRQRMYADKTRMLEREREDLVRQIDEMSLQGGNEVHAATLAELTSVELQSRLAELKGQQSGARVEVVKLVEIKGRCHERLRLLDHVPTAKKSKARWKDVLAKSLELAELVDVASDRHEAHLDAIVDDTPIQTATTFQLLDRASEYLAALGDSSLRKIRFDNDGLEDEGIGVEVLGKKGKWYPAADLRPQQLSILYTCLWMAQLAAFQDQGVHLPIVVEDPLSLVGQRRAERLAEQLCQFAASGHQVLVVTSNAKHAQVFADLDVPIADFAQRYQQVAEVPERGDWSSEHSTEPVRTEPIRENGRAELPQHRYA